jgi:hypothetical protein
MTEQKFPRRDLNPGFPSESRISWPTRLQGMIEIVSENRYYFVTFVRQPRPIHPSFSARFVFGVDGDKRTATLPYIMTLSKQPFDDFCRRHHATTKRIVRTADWEGSSVQVDGILLWPSSKLTMRWVTDGNIVLYSWVFSNYGKRDTGTKSKKFPRRDLNPGLPGESRISWPTRLQGNFESTWYDTVFVLIRLLNCLSIPPLPTQFLILIAEMEVNEISWFPNRGWSRGWTRRG